MSHVLLRTQAFVRAASRFIKKHPESVENLSATLALMAVNVYDPRLRTHRLKGLMAGCLACSAGYDTRIVFRFVTHEGRAAVLLLSIGSHDEVY